VSSFRSGLEELRGEDLAHAGDRQVEADFEELESVVRALEVERDRRLVEIDRRRTWERHGHVSTAAWLVSRFRMAWSVATRRVRTALALDEMASTRDGVASGEVSPCAAQVLVDARQAHPEAFARDQEILVSAAESLSVRDLRRAVAHWKEPLDGPAALDEAKRTWEARRLHLSTTLGGMVRVDGDLDPETGQTVISALGAVVDAEARHGEDGERRTPAQRRADALGEVCRQWLDRSDRPVVAGERPHVTVVVDAAALRGELGSRCELSDAGPVHPEVARGIACDASVARVVMRGASEPLDVGRQTPVVPAPMRRAVVVRDRHCRFPGCDRPPRWTDAHHVRHWADGGVTALANLVLLCRRHHRVVHVGGFGVEMTGAGPLFRRPDGSILEERAPP
jgi:hypothetical protein